MVINISENLHVNENGAVYINDERIILTSISAFGTLRRDLINTIGTGRMKGFLIRYGMELGKEDGEKILTYNLGSIKEKIDYGPVLHKMKGHAVIKKSKLETKEEGGKVSVHIEGTWKGSYEAEEHIRQFGLSQTPVCYTLTGYGSGYLTEICNQTVIFKELSCQAEGHSECRWVGKSLDYWDGEVDDELQFYRDKPIVKELEMTYEKLLEERNNLEISTLIHEKLTKEILQGKDLESIAKVVFEATGTPGMISNANHTPLTYNGLSPKQFDEVNEEFKKYLKPVMDSDHDSSEQIYRDIRQTKHIRLDHHSRLITPIFLQNKIVGYCTFIYLDHQVTNEKIHKMILERVSTVCSLFLLNEKTKFGADRRMREHFFDEILKGDYKDEEEIVRRGSLIGLDLTDYYRIVNVRYENPEKNFEKELAFHEEILETTAGYFNDKNESVLVAHGEHSVILLVPKKYIEKDGVEQYCWRYLQTLSSLFPSIVFFAGISKESKQILQAKNHYNEALTAQRMASTNNSVMSFDSLGILGPLINQNNNEEIKHIAQNMVGPLLGKAGSKKNELVKTLYVFLANGGNLEKTAMDTTLSLSGLRYRLQKIEELLGHDLRDPFYNYQLYLALQSLLLTGVIEIERQ